MAVFNAYYFVFSLIDAKLINFLEGRKKDKITRNNLK